MDDSSGDASSPAAGSSHRYPDWVMLDRHTRLNYPRPTLNYAEEHFRATHAYAETSKGDPVRVSFRAVPPPGTSRVYVRWARPPERGEEDRWDRSYGGEPMILAAHGNSLLLQITTLENNRSDFFVYTVDPIGQPPSLQRLPRCDHEFTMGDHYRGLEHMFDLEGIGLLCDAATGEFAVADLIVVGINGVQGHDTPVEAGLCVYRSGRSEDGWTATRPRIRHENGQGRDLIFWETDAVVSFGDSLCYVDYLRGVLFMDVLSACPQLRYVRLPVNIPAGDSVDPETGLRGCPEASRSVCVTDGGATMKFVEVVSCTVFISGSHAPASSSFTINMWKLNQDSMTWGKEASMEDTELWSLQGYGGDLPRAAPEYPLVSMKEPEVVYFVLGARNWGADGDGTWVIVVDMLNKTLRSSSRYTSVYQNCFESDGNMASASLFTNLGFMACEFSKYLPTRA
uniref:Uncharacterized protein n=1 Tax=Avena sativa TaxID=4498 RepID=A0ACD5VCH9_AVESA